MYQKMANFENAYDQMVIKGKMVDEAIETNMGEKGTVSNVNFPILSSFIFFLILNIRNFYLFKSLVLHH
jgi:hypothetical protein